VDFFLRHPEAGAVFCHDIFIDAEGREYGRLKAPKEIRGKEVLTYQTILNAILTNKNGFFPAPSSMVRACVYHEVGLYRSEEFQIASDLEMWLRIGRKYPIGLLHEYLFRYRHGHGNWSQRYLHLRTETERHFQILDLHLTEGGRGLATERALRAHEAHRAEDRLMLAVNNYILDRRGDARALLGRVKTSQIIKSPMVQRTRLLLLLFLLKCLVPLPRIGPMADAFYRRWHVDKFAPKRQVTSAG
jgi:hypothetical protein